MHQIILTFSISRMYVCTICNLFGGNNFAAVLRHIGELHRYDPGLVIRCGIDCCPQTYNNFESYRSHVYRKHRYALHSNSSGADSSRDDTVVPMPDSYDLPDIPMCVGNNTSKDLGAKLLLKIKEEYRIPQSTLNKIIGDVKGMWTVSHESVKKKVMSFVSSKLPEKEIEELAECFDNSFPLQGLETEHMQLKYYKEHFNDLVSA